MDAIHAFIPGAPSAIAEVKARFTPPGDLAIFGLVATTLDFFNDTLSIIQVKAVDAAVARLMATYPSIDYTFAKSVAIKCLIKRKYKISDGWVMNLDFYEVVTWVVL